MLNLFFLGVYKAQDWKALPIFKERAQNKISGVNMNLVYLSITALITVKFLWKYTQKC